MWWYPTNFIWWTLIEWVYWYFEPSQRLWIISGLKETFTMRNTVKRTNKTEIRLEEQSEKTESCWENFGMKYSWKGHKNRNRHKNRIKRSGKLGWFMSDINHNIPTMWRWARRGTGWTYLLSFTWSYHFQWPWPWFQVKAMSNSFNRKFYVIIWLS